MPQTESPKGAPPQRNHWKKLGGLAAGGLLLLASLLFSLMVAEAGFRIVAGLPVFAASDWRHEGIRTKRIGDRAVPDPVLGWTLKEHYRSPGFNTIHQGVRRNFDEAELRTGSILAVGDSFTEGFEEVTDEGTWPAHLEAKLNMPVINAGVAGYATDQIIMRAEQLLPVVKPETLIIGFTDVDVYRAALSEAGAPKPYFTVEEDALVFHPPKPLSDESRENALGNAARSVLSYSALADHLFSRLAPRFWYPSEASVYQEVENDPYDITCRLLARVKTLTGMEDIRLLLFLQYGGEQIVEEDEIVYDMQRVTQCAQDLQIQTVDQFASLKAATGGDPDKVAEYYAVEGEEFGHMVSKGNEHAAELLAEVLREPEEAEPVNAAMEKPDAEPVSNLR